MAASASFAMDQLLQDSPPMVIPQPGELIEGKVIDCNKHRILVEISGVNIGIVSGREARDSMDTLKSVQPGDDIWASVLESENEEGFVVLSLRKASQERAWQRFNEAYENNEVIEVKASEANKGGLLLQVDGIKGFIPVSQLAPLHYPRVNGADAGLIFEKLRKLIGIPLSVKIINIDKENGKLILSERAAYEEERRHALKDLKIGDRVKGKISGVVKFGIFVAFDGLEGLVHISEIAWGHVKDPSEHGRVGDPVEVQVIGVEGDKISLSIKRLIPDPWAEVAKEFSVGKVVTGEITRLAPFGAFMKLTDEINGLIHLSELVSKDGGSVNDASEILTVGQSVEAKVIDVNLEEHRIGLSLKLGKETEKEKKENKKESKEKNLETDEQENKEEKKPKAKTTSKKKGKIEKTDES